MPNLCFSSYVSQQTTVPHVCCNYSYAILICFWHFKAVYIKILFNLHLFKLHYWKMYYLNHFSFRLKDIESTIKYIQTSLNIKKKHLTLLCTTFLNPKSFLSDIYHIYSRNLCPRHISNPPSPALKEMCQGFINLP